MHYFVYHIDILITTFWTVFRRFPINFRRLPFEDSPSEQFRKMWKITEDWKTFEEDSKMFRSYTNKFKYSLRFKHDVTEIIDIFTGEDMENTLPDFRI